MLSLLDIEPEVQLHIFSNFVSHSDMASHLQCPWSMMHFIMLSHLVFPQLHIFSISIEEVTDSSGEVLFTNHYLVFHC